MALFRVIVDNQKLVFFSEKKTVISFKVFILISLFLDKLLAITLITKTKFEFLCGINNGS